MKKMKSWQHFLICFLLLFSFLIAQPAFADKPKFKKNSDYIEVSKTLQALNLSPSKNTDVIAKEISELEFIKYTLESGINWGQCTNNTGNTLAVYGKDPQQEEDDDESLSSYDSDLFFLADGKTTANGWDCDGFYVPVDVKYTTIDYKGNIQELTGATAVKIIDGTKLVIDVNPQNGNFEFDVPLVKALKTGEINWFIPNIAQYSIDSRVPNAPVSES